MAISKDQIIYWFKRKRRMYFERGLMKAKVILKLNSILNTINNILCFL